jgi:hypothetical protein
MSWPEISPNGWAWSWCSKVAGNRQFLAYFGCRTASYLSYVIISHNKCAEKWDSVAAYFRDAWWDYPCFLRIRPCSLEALLSLDGLPVCPWSLFIEDRISLSSYMLCGYLARYTRNVSWEMVSFRVKMHEPTDNSIHDNQNVFTFISPAPDDLILSYQLERC